MYRVYTSTIQPACTGQNMGSDYMDIHANQELHSTIWLSIAALREYDKVKYWDEDMQDEVTALLVKLEKSIQRERLYYATYRNIQMTDDNSSL